MNLDKYFEKHDQVISNQISALQNYLRELFNSPDITVKNSFGTLQVFVISDVFHDPYQRNGLKQIVINCLNNDNLNKLKNMNLDVRALTYDEVKNFIDKPLFNGL